MIELQSNVKDVVEFLNNSINRLKERGGSIKIRQFIPELNESHEGCAR